MISKYYSIYRTVYTVNLVLPIQNLRIFSCCFNKIFQIYRETEYVTTGLTEIRMPCTPKEFYSREIERLSSCKHATAGLTEIEMQYGYNAVFTHTKGSPFISVNACQIQCQKCERCLAKRHF